MSCLKSMSTNSWPEESWRRPGIVLCQWRWLRRVTPRIAQFRRPYWWALWLSDTARLYLPAIYTLSLIFLVSLTVNFTSYTCPIKLQHLSDLGWPMLHSLSLALPHCNQHWCAYSHRTFWIMSGDVEFLFYAILLLILAPFHYPRLSILSPYSTLMVDMWLCLGLNRILLERVIV